MQLEAVTQNYSDLYTKYDLNKLNKNKIETTELDNLILKLQSNVDNFKIKTRKCGIIENFNNKTVYLNDDLYNFIVSNKVFFKYIKILNKEMKLRDLRSIFKYIDPQNLINNTSLSIYEDIYYELKKISNSKYSSKKLMINNFIKKYTSINQSIKI
jgi:hypothetical protein